MPGPFQDYSRQYQEVAPYNEWGLTGIDPGYTSLAMQLGYQPNPFAAQGTEGQAQMRFLATLKHVMDQQMGGPNGAAAQLSPSNPIAGMPFNMAQYLGLAGALMQSQTGRSLMPGSQAATFQRGYQFGDMPTAPGDLSAYQQFLRDARMGNQPFQAGQGQGPPSQGTTITPTPPGQQAAATTEGQLNRGMDSSQISGLPGDAASNPALAAPSGGNPQSALPEGASNQSILAAALAQQGQPTPPSGGTPVGPQQVPPPLAQAWEAYMRSRGQLTAQSARNELDFWTNPAFQGFADWVKQNVGRPQ